jgi:hypothetical protein
MAANGAVLKSENVPDIPLLFHKKFANVQGIGLGQTGTFNFPPAGTFYEWRFLCLQSNGTPATQTMIETDITDIRVRINGDLFIDLKPAELNMIQAFYGDHKGAAVVNGVVLIDWARRNLNLPRERWQYAIGTQGVNSIQVQFLFRTGAPLDVAAIIPYALMTNEERPVGPHFRLLPYPQSKATAGDHQITDLPTTPGIGYLAMHVGLGTGTLDKTSLLVDTVDIVDEIPAPIQQQLSEHHYRNPQSGYRHVSFDYQNEVLNYLPMERRRGDRVVQVRDFRLELTWSVAPGNFRILTEQVHGLAPLG